MKPLILNVFPKNRSKYLQKKTRTCQIHDFKSQETEVLSAINELLRSTKNGVQEDTDVIMKNIDNIETKMEMDIGHQIRGLEIQIEEEIKTVEQKKKNFRHLNYTPKIICSFEIHDLYPFGLLDIKLASIIGIQSLERQLIRKAKPGFVYIELLENRLFNRI